MTYQTDEEVRESFDERFPLDEKDGSMFYTRRLVKEWIEDLRKNDREWLESEVSEIQTELHNGRMESAYEMANKLLTLLEPKTDV